MSNQVKEVEEIKVFIKKLQNQIKKKKKNIKYNYVVLNLEKNVNKLTKLLENEDVIKYIINNFNYYKPIFKDTEDTEDTEGNNWYLIISGFKYGATKNSPRELGLIAHKKIFDIDNFIIKFKTKLLYSSILFPETSNKESINIVKHIEFGIKLYLEDKFKYNEETNYINEETSYIKKKSLKKLKNPTIYDFIKKKLKKKNNLKNEKNNSIN